MSERALRRNIRLFYLVRFLRYLQVWIPVWVIYLTVEQGFSLAEVTTADGLFFAGVTLLEVPTGAVADRWGRGRSVGLGAVFLALALLLFAFTTSFPILLASFLVWAVAETLASGADLALLFDTLKALGREDEYEKHAGRGEAALAAGAALGTLLGGPVAAVTGIQATILIGVVTTLVMGGLAFSMAEAPRQASGTQTRNYLSNLREAFRVVTSDRPLLLLLAFLGLVSAALEAEMYLVQPFLLAQGIEVGFLFSLIQFPVQTAAVVGALLAAVAARHLGPTRLLPAVAAGGALSFLMIWAMPGRGGLAIMPIAPMLAAISRPVVSGYVNRRVPSEQRATVLSMESFAIALALAPLAPLVGATADHRGIPAAFGLLALVCGGGGLVAGTAWLRAHARFERLAPAKAVLHGGDVPVVPQPLAD